MRKVFLSLSLMAYVALNAASPYLSKVYDFMPAPGQFVNELPEYDDGDDLNDIISKVEEQICGDKMPGMVTLGAWGGYVVFGFDHPVVNIKGDYDFKIYGNAFAATGSTTGGSCEPGIVMVSYDDNGNGIPDDKWYELAGSEYGKSTTIQQYRLTYYRTPSTHVPNPDNDYKYITDRTYIRWTDNCGGEGYVMKNSFHNQDYWPMWIDADTLIFEGARLPDNGVDRSSNGTNYVLSFFDYGYVDNRPNNEDRGFNIDWAVDEHGEAVHLPAIHFIKVYNAINQYCGWLGETSTEIQGGEDLHPDAEVSGIDIINVNALQEVEYFNLQGVKVENPQQGMFLMRKGHHISKVML